MDAQTKQRREESVLNMEQRRRVAVMKDAQSLFRRKDSVSDITNYQMGRVWLYDLSPNFKLIQQSSKLLPTAFKRPRYT